MQMYIDGAWVDSPTSHAIRSSWSGEIVDTVPVATPEQVQRTLDAAVRGAATMAALTGYERSQILHRAADRIGAELEDLAHTISLEEGKPISESRGEVSRVPDFLRLCAHEGTQARGESLPLDSHTGTRGKIGLTLRIPCGVVVAITPFNYPLLLVMHKVGPALAAGNAVILKPANSTPLTALKFTRILIESGLPENALQCITGSGSTIGPQLCADPRVRKISFTGSTSIGEQITRVAGVKRLSLELGSNCPLIVLRDADMDAVAAATAAGGYINAGQVCISTQRVLVAREAYGDFLDALKPRVEAIKTGNPLAADTRLGPMISEQEAQRVDDWVGEAVHSGARVVTGGQRSGALYAPTIVADVRPEMRISCEELFGAVVAVTPVHDISEAIALANDSRYGLGAGIFTQNIGHAMRFVQEVQSGNVHVNWTALWRADFMPYGGLRGSGIGKEGPRYAVQEMTELKTVIFHSLGA
ncbi:MAG: aldehyde dehydrogenase family protein [Chloroflexi bacterium]|nr:aldehyde dehydrogenase family protein [Chloroflexota bacterium]